MVYKVRGPGKETPSEKQAPWITMWFLDFKEQGPGAEAMPKGQAYECLCAKPRAPPEVWIPQEYSRALHKIYLFRRAADLSKQKNQ